MEAEAEARPIRSDGFDHAFIAGSQLHARSLSADHERVERVTNGPSRGGAARHYESRVRGHCVHHATPADRYMVFCSAP